MGRSKFCCCCDPLGRSIILLSDQSRFLLLALALPTYSTFYNTQRASTKLFARAIIPDAATATTAASSSHVVKGSSDARACLRRPPGGFLTLLCGTFLHNHGSELAQFNLSLRCRWKMGRGSGACLSGPSAEHYHTSLGRAGARRLVHTCSRNADKEASRARQAGPPLAATQP